MKLNNIHTISAEKKTKYFTCISAYTE